MDRSTVHKLIGNNKLAANERNLDLTTTLLAFPKNGTTQNTINCNLVCQIVVTKNYCQYWMPAIKRVQVLS